MGNAREFVSVLAVLAGLLGAVWLLRGRPGKLPALWRGDSKGPGFRVLQRVVLTPHHSIHLVDLGGDRLVLAAGPGGVQVLRELGPVEKASPGATPTGGHP